VVPPGIDTLAAERVVVGWKDTREARRALRDALPFLACAATVALVEICDEPSVGEGRQHLEDVARYLTRHKVKVGAKNRDPSRRPCRRRARPPRRGR